MAELTSRACRAFAAGFAELRADWDEEGVSAALWLNRRNNPYLTVAAMAKAASDQRNDTPTAVNFTSSQGPMPNPCRDHPLSKIRDNGECAGCYVDKRAAVEPLPLAPKSVHDDEFRQRIRGLVGGAK